MRGIGTAAGVLCAVMMLAAGSASAAASGGAVWNEAKLPDLAGSLYLLNVSCPSEALCVATGSQNVIASSTNPAGGVGDWRVVYAGEGPYESPTGVPVISNRQIQGVSCPTPHLCVAVTTLGQIYSTTNPTGPASAWRVTEVPSSGGNTHLYGVSCPTASLCVAVSGRRVNRGKVFTSTDPDGGAESWSMTDLGEGFDFRAVSCSSATLCVAVGAQGELVGTRNPTGGPSAWFSLGAPGGPGNLQAVSCVSGLCLSGNTGGNLLTSSSPLDPTSWREAGGGGSVQITGASCASASACIAVDNNGHVHTSTDPTGGSSAWADTVLVPYTAEVEQFNPENGNGLFGASCPSARLCAVVGSRGRIFTSTNPFASRPVDPQPAGRHPKRGAKRPRARIARLDLPSLRDLKAHRGRVMVRFHAPGAVRRFECKITGRRFRPCHSPARFRVGFGSYAIRVRAVGLTGLRGPADVERFWTGKRCVRKQCLTGSGELPTRPGPQGR